MFNKKGINLEKCNYGLYCSFLHLHFPNVIKNPIDFAKIMYNQQLYEIQSVSKSQRSKLLDK